jgi:hypothetical protein
MRDLLDDDLASRLGAEAYTRYWSDPQSLDAHTRDLLAIYRTVISQHRARLLEAAPQRQNDNVLGVGT